MNYIERLRDESQYYSVLKESVEFFEESFPVHVNFGGIIGSIGYGLNNATSDVDAVLFFSMKEGESFSIKNEVNRTIEFSDIVGILPVHMEFFDYINSTEQQIPPEIFPHHILPKPNIDDTLLPGAPHSRARAIITEVLSFGKIWDDRKFLTLNMPSLRKHLLIYDFQKKQYIYAQGRLDNYLNGDTVRMRTYLYTARDILAIQYVFRYEAFPPVDFEVLLDGCDDTYVKRFLSELYDKNRKSKSNKESADMKPNHAVNAYFSEMLAAIKIRLQRYYYENPSPVFDVCVI